MSSLSLLAGRSVYFVDEKKVDFEELMPICRHVLLVKAENY